MYIHTHTRTTWAHGPVGNVKRSEISPALGGPFKLLHAETKASMHPKF